MQPIYERSSNKNVHYTIDDQFLKFWFRFIYKYTHIIEAGGNERLKTIAERDFTDIIHILSTHKIVSTEVESKENGEIRIRQCTEPGKDVQDIYECLIL